MIIIITRWLWNKAKQGPFRRSRSFKVTDFGTNRKLIYDFLLVITVCTVVQDCCKGRSDKYRKWRFWGSCRPETPEPINMKFGMDDYVRDTTRHPKWHVSWIRGVTPTNGWNVKGLCFLVYFCYRFFSGARGQTAGPILTSYNSKCAFLGELHS